MSIFDDLKSFPIVLTEGSVIERLRRDPEVKLDRWTENAALIYNDSGRRALRSIYSQYLDIGRRHDLPMIVFSPTWRANPDRVQKAGLAGRDVNGDAVRFLSDLRAEYGPYAQKVFLGGLIGCRGDAYRPEESLSSEEGATFHQEQIRALAAAGVDFLCAATLPAAAEGAGIARAMAGTSLPYVLSFVLGADGALLDGTPMHEIIAEIDATTRRPPAFYMINCVHPSVFRRAYMLESMAAQKVTQRISGLQANTSPRSPHELDGLPILETEDPERLADAMMRLHKDFGLRILGGCCGTDDRHIARLAERAAALLTPAAWFRILPEYRPAG